MRTLKKVLIFNKKEGETPLEALDVFRARNRKYEDTKMTYAGRLDPMASGLLVVLAGDEVKNKEKYLKLDKEYEFEILFGFTTDTYDILGKVTRSCLVEMTVRELEKIIKQNLKFFTGKFVQKYPLYSSKTVLGKQLFQYGREGVDVERPEREVFVKSLKFIKLRKINNKILLESIEKRIRKVNGDFRQKEIIKIWQKELEQGESLLKIASFKIKCSSGTYVRGVANSLGEKLDIPALAFSIKRTKIGVWKKPKTLK
jgi:tRNA pseudouridine55 synthase